MFNKYGWRWEKPRHPLGGWLPDFLLKGDTSVYVECKAFLQWDKVQDFSDLIKYEDAVRDSSFEVLLIPESPKNIKNDRGYTSSILGVLYDGTMWSYAELGRWSGRVGFCHSGNSWKDRMSGENVQRSMGDGQRPDAELDWRSAKQVVKGKRLVFFKAFSDSEVKEWDLSQ